jgi:hypothetical protein
MNETLGTLKSHHQRHLNNCVVPFTVEARDGAFPRIANTPAVSNRALRPLIRGLIVENVMVVALRDKEAMLSVRTD